MSTDLRRLGSAPESVLVELNKGALVVPLILTVLVKNNVPASFHGFTVKVPIVKSLDFDLRWAYLTFPPFLFRAPSSNIGISISSAILQLLLRAQLVIATLKTWPSRPLTSRPATASSTWKSSCYTLPAKSGLPNMLLSLGRWPILLLLVVLGQPKIPQELKHFVSVSREQQQRSSSRQNLMRVSTS